MGSEVDPNALRALIRSSGANHAIIERVGPMPRDGVMQAWRFSATFAVAKTVVALIGMPLLLVPASSWKRAMKVQGGPIGKEQCRIMAIQRFPNHAADFARKKDAGRAEAALLAIYAADLSEKKL
jgi:crossover junction endodeoxyribonuclease RuvC